MSVLGMFVVDCEALRIEKTEHIHEPSYWDTKSGLLPGLSIVRRLGDLSDTQMIIYVVTK